MTTQEIKVCKGGDTSMCSCRVLQSKEISDPIKQVGLKNSYVYCQGHSSHRILGRVVFLRNNVQQLEPMDSLHISIILESSR